MGTLDKDLRKLFLNLLVYSSLDSKQLNYLGELQDSTFNIYKVSGFGERIPIPRQSAAEILVDYFGSEEEVVDLFTILLRFEGTRFYNSQLIIYDADKLINFLKKRKWIYDEEMKRFLRDPFFEHEINFLNSIRVIDLRDDSSLETLISTISSETGNLGDKDLEWAVNLRLYDLDREKSKLIQQVLSMLLVRQNLNDISFDVFTCLKELVINATKANYKLLYEKFVAAPQGITSAHSYPLFLKMFKEEIENHGNSNLKLLAKKKDKFINITFQSTNNDIAVWVVNNQNITLVEKNAILKKLGYKEGSDLFAYADNDDYKEGAGLGIPLVLSLLRLYSSDRTPLKVVFYPNFIKVGFLLNREEARRGIEAKKAEMEAQKDSSD